MTPKLLDSIDSRLEDTLENVDEPEHRREIREIRQLVVGVREELENDAY